MQYFKFLRLAVAALILVPGAFASRGAAAQEVNMWDGQWHIDTTAYVWVPFMYTTVQLPDAVGGGNPTIETQPSQYLKYLRVASMFQATIQKGDWGLWTDFVYLNLGTTPSKTRQVMLPADIDVPVTLALDTGLRGTIWTMAPSYTVIHNDTVTLDVLAGFRYTSFRISIAYNLYIPATPIAAGGVWPSSASMDGLVGLKGSVRLGNSNWYIPYEADVGAGDKNWNYNAITGISYHLHWGDVTLAVRNLTYNKTGDVALEKVRMTGPALAATIRW